MLRAVAAVRGRRRRARGADGAVEERGAELDVLLLARLVTCCCCSPSTVADAAQQWEDGERRKKMMTCGARESVTGEGAFIAIYVFIYTYSWAQVVSIRILCHFCEKRKIIMVCFEIDE